MKRNASAPNVFFKFSENPIRAKKKPYMTCLGFYKTRSTQWKGYRHPQEGGEESQDREVWILIPLQMAGSVWKSKHFKMKSSNDWSNDHEHTVGKHNQVDDQPHKKLSTLLKALHLFVTETLCLTPQNLSVLTDFAFKLMIHSQTTTKNKKRIFPFLFPVILTSRLLKLLNFGNRSLDFCRDFWMPLCHPNYHESIN